MPNMDGGRQKIRDYLKEHNLTMATLAVQYSMTRQGCNEYPEWKIKIHKQISSLLGLLKILKFGNAKST